MPAGVKSMGKPIIQRMPVVYSSTFLDTLFNFLPMSSR